MGLNHVYYIPISLILVNHAGESNVVNVEISGVKRVFKLFLGPCLQVDSVSELI